MSKDEDLAFELGVSFLPFLACYRGTNQVDSFTEADPDAAIARVETFASAMDDDLPPPKPKQVIAADKKKAETVAFPVLRRLTSASPLKLFVAGDRSKVGKSR